jgi:hypothetical protein
LANADKFLENRQNKPAIKTGINFLKKFLADEPSASASASTDDLGAAQ